MGAKELPRVSQPHTSQTFSGLVCCFCWPHSAPMRCPGSSGGSSGGSSAGRTGDRQVPADPWATEVSLQGTSRRSGFMSRLVLTVGMEVSRCRQNLDEMAVEQRTVTRADMEIMHSCTIRLMNNKFQIMLFKKVTCIIYAGLSLDLL